MQLTFLEPSIVLIFIAPFEAPMPLPLPFFKISMIMSCIFQIFQILFCNDLLALPFQIPINPVSFPVVVLAVKFTMTLYHIIFKLAFIVAFITIRLFARPVLVALRELPHIDILLNFLFPIAVRHPILPLSIVAESALDIGEETLSVLLPILENALIVGSIWEDADSKMGFRDSLGIQFAIVDLIASCDKQIVLIRHSIAIMDGSFIQADLLDGPGYLVDGLEFAEGG